MSVSVQLRTYPSPNPTLTWPCYQLTVIGLGEGFLRNCSDTHTDTKFPCKELFLTDHDKFSFSFTTLNWKVVYFFLSPTFIASLNVFIADGMELNNDKSFECTTINLSKSSWYQVSSTSKLNFSTVLFRFIVKLILLLGRVKWLEKSLNNFHNFGYWRETNRLPQVHTFEGWCLLV